MRSLFISDLHASLRLPHARLDPSATRSDRLDDVCAVLDAVIAAAAERDVAHAFVLGDLFHRRHPDAPTLEAVSRKLHRLAAVVDQVYLLPGNHDAHDKAGRVYSLSFLDALQVPGITVLLEPRPMTLGGVTFWPVPWVPRQLTRRRIAELRPAMAVDQTHVLLMHQTIAGCVDNGRTMRRGMRLSELAPFDLVLSGHIHRPQVHGHSVYLGSPLELRASENDGQPRGFWIMDHDNPLALEQVALSTTPKFLKWTFEGPGALDDLERLEAVMAEQAEALSATLRARPVYLDVLVEGPAEALREACGALHRLLEEADAKARGLRQLRLNRVVTDGGASARVRASAASGRIASPRGLVRAFVESSATEALPDERAALVALGRALLEGEELPTAEARAGAGDRQEVRHGRA